MRALCLAVAVSTSLVASAAAQEVPSAMDAPWSEVAPHIDGQNVIAAALGAPDTRMGRISARRAAARRLAQERARAMLRAWALEALASVSAPERASAAIAEAIERGATVVRTRALFDGGAVVEIAVPLAALRSAFDQRGLPWSER